MNVSFNTKMAVCSSFDIYPYWGVRCPYWLDSGEVSWGTYVQSHHVTERQLFE